MRFMHVGDFLDFVVKRMPASPKMHKDFILFYFY